MRIAKYALLGLGGLVLIAAIAAAIFAATFDPNRYRGEIERLAKERTGRTLKLEGPLEVAFFPSLGAKVSGVMLTERASERQFLTLESAHGSVKLMPLLRGEVIVDRVRIAGLKANVVKDKSGRFNFEDLLAEDAKPAPEAKKGKQADTGPSGGGAVKFDIAGVSVERSAISYADQGSGRQLQLSDVKLETGRIAERADGRLVLQTKVSGKNPALDLGVDLSGDYKVDLPAKSYLFANVDGTIKGTLEQDAVEAKIAAPRLDLTPDQASGEAVTLELRQKGPQRTAEARLKLGGLQGSAKALAIPSLTADVALTGSDVPRPIKLAITGSARADLEKQTASADLQTRLDESSIRAKLGLAKFSPPAYTFDVSVDRLDLDQYLGEAKPAPAAAPKKEETKKPAAPAQAPQDTPVDLSALKDLNASGRLQFGALKVRGLKLSSVKAEVKAANGRMEVAPHSAALYEGNLNGALTLNVNSNQVSLKETLTSVSVGPLLRDFAQQDRLEGRGNVALDITTAGKSLNAMKKALNGTAKIELRDGAVKGFDIAGLLRKVKSLGKSEQGAVDNKQKTDFSELSASFVIKNGVAHNQDLDLKAPLVRVSGAGTVDVAASTLDYLAKASVVATSKGQGGRELDELAGLTVPVKLTGPFDGLKYEVDYGAVAAGLAKSRVGGAVKEQVEKRREAVEDKVRERLKGLSGR